jgi:predicted acetyltransferase
MGSSWIKGHDSDGISHPQTIVQQRQPQQKAKMEVEVSLVPYERRDVILNLAVFFKYEILPWIHGIPGGELNQWGTFGESARTHAEAVSVWESFWNKPGVCFPYLISADGKTAGFATVASRPHCHPFVDFRMNDFFVVNKYRRMGVGKQAAYTIFDRHRGNWEVDWSNPGADAFWHRIVGEYAGNNFREWQVTGEYGPEDADAWLLFASRTT